MAILVLTCTIKKTIYFCKNNPYNLIILLLLVVCINTKNQIQYPNSKNHSKLCDLIPLYWKETRKLNTMADKQKRRYLEEM